MHGRARSIIPTACSIRRGTSRCCRTSRREVWDVGARERPTPDRPLYVVAEKILSGRERLPARWAVHGTTGYNFLNQLNGLFVTPAHARRMRRAYAKLTGQTPSFDDLLYASKRLIMDTAMASELTVLAHMLDRIGETNRQSRDFTLDSMRDVLVEVVACFPVYRTYVNEHGWAPEDRAVVERAVVRARRRNPAMEASIFDFFREVVLPRDPADVRASGRGTARRLSASGRRRGRRAAAVRDEAAAIHRSAAGEGARGHGVLPLQPAAVAERGRRRSLAVRRGVDEFHARASSGATNGRSRCSRRPRTTPSSARTCARASTCSRKSPPNGSARCRGGCGINRAHRSIVDGEPAPDRNDEYRFYQAVRRRLAASGGRWKGRHPTTSIACRAS